MRDKQRIELEIQVLMLQRTVFEQNQILAALQIPMVDDKLVELRKELEQQDEIKS